MGSESRDYWVSEAVRLTDGAVATKAELDEKIELDQSCGPLGLVCVSISIIRSRNMMYTLHCGFDRQAPLRHD